MKFASATLPSKFAMLSALVAMFFLFLYAAPAGSPLNVGAAARLGATVMENTVPLATPSPLFANSPLPLSSPSNQSWRRISMKVWPKRLAAMRRWC